MLWAFCFLSVWCFALICGSSWQKYIDFHRFVILLESKISFFGSGCEFIHCFCEHHKFNKTQVSLWNIFVGNVLTSLTIQISRFVYTYDSHVLPPWILNTFTIVFTNCSFLFHSEKDTKAAVINPCFAFPCLSSNCFIFWLKTQLFSEIEAYILLFRFVFCCSLSKWYTKCHHGSIS